MRIEIEGLVKTYHGGVRALDGVDLTIPGGIHGLLGPNGAGKTTLMRILAGILHASGGRALVGGNDLSTEHGRTEVKRSLGYLPQELGLYPDLNAREFLEYVALLKGMDDTPARRGRVAELLETVGLQDQARRKLKTFSGGMKRRIGIAQALLNDPSLLIVDEPTVGLDPEERIHFRTLLAELAGARTVLLSTHIVEDIAQTSRSALRFGSRPDSLHRHDRGACRRGPRARVHDAHGRAAPGRRADGRVDDPARHHDRVPRRRLGVAGRGRRTRARARGRLRLADAFGSRRGRRRLSPDAAVRRGRDSARSYWARRGYSRAAIAIKTTVVAESTAKSSASGKLSVEPWTIRPRSASTW